MQKSGCRIGRPQFSLVMEVILAWTLTELISPLTELMSPLAEVISPLAELIPALAELIPAAWDVCSIPLCRAGALSGLGAFRLGQCSRSSEDRSFLHPCGSSRFARDPDGVARPCPCRHALFGSGSNSYYLCPTHPAFYERGWVGGVVL